MIEPEDTAIHEENFRITGPSSFENNQRRKSTLNYVLCVIIGAFGGTISGIIPFSALIKFWYPFVGGTQLVSGHHILWMMLIYAITKKKGNILITALIQGSFTALFGSSWGLYEILITGGEGILLFGFIFLLEKTSEKNTYWGWGVACGLANAPQVAFFWVITGKFILYPIELFILSTLLAITSGFLIAGILSKSVYGVLVKTGIL